MPFPKRLSRLLAPLQPVIALFTGGSARAGYLAAMDQALISLANFLATLVLARNVDPTQLGIYGVGFTVLRLVRAFQEGLTIQPLNIYGAAMDDEGFRRYATSTSLIQVLLALVSAACVALVGWALTAAGNDTAGPTVFFLWSSFLWWQLQEYLRRMMYTRGQVFDAVFNTVLANGVRLGIMYWWAAQGELSGYKGLQAIALGSLVALVPGVWQTRAYWSRHFTSLSHTWQKNWQFGRWVLGSMIASWVSVEFYPVLTAGMISFAAAGAYRALQNLVAPVQLLLRATDTFLTPRAARAYHDSGQPALARLVRLTYLVTGIPILSFLAFIVLFPVPVLFLLYGKTYLPYSEGIYWMAAFYALMYAYWPLQTAFKAARISQPLFVANIAAVATMATVGIWMIHQWGVYGTIGGQALNALVVLIVLWVAWSGMQRNR